MNKINNEVYKSNIKRNISYEMLVQLSNFRSVLSLANKNFNEYISSEDTGMVIELTGPFKNVAEQLNKLAIIIPKSHYLSEELLKLEKMTSEKFNLMEEAIKYRRENQDDQLFTVLKKILHQNSGIRDAMITIENYEIDVINNWEQQVMQKQKDTSLVIFAGTVTTCLLFFIIFYLLNKEIAERKIIEGEIRNEMQFTERLLNSSIDGIISFDRNCNFSLWNPGMESLTGISGSRVIGKNAFSTFPILKQIGEDKYFYEALKGNFIIAKDRWINFSETDKEFYYEAYYSPVYDLSKEIVGGLAIIRNTTQRKLALEALEKAKVELEKRVIERTAALSKANDELKNEVIQRKLAQEQINQSLQEKVILLQEIHHRVKNNLQVISSLLNLQSGYIEDEKSLEIFRESQNRVRSMALIHERLYQSKDLNKIEFAGYISSLCKDLFSSYNIDTDRISLKSDLTGIFFEIDTAILCGLIINELISNSLKHAFPENRRGEIYIGLHFIEGSGYILIVRDNGIGFPDDLDFRNTESLGLQLVNTLTEQLGGNIELNTNNNTEFKITFISKHVTKAENPV
ncbi:MAG: histidine kinase dimerization/phosphoacceptor domain -containing protein [Ignavibacteriaceae bacterium]